MRRLKGGFHWVCMNPLLFFIFYTTGASVFVQVLILRYLFPEMHAGDGMMLNGDWVDYHLRSVKYAQIIRTYGWDNYLSLPYEKNIEQTWLTYLYSLGFMKPWLMTPFLVIFHAFASWVCFNILKSIFKSSQYALIATLPYLVFPTSLTWVSQIHKDGLFFLGFFISFVGWRQFVQVFTEGIVFRKVQVYLLGVLALTTGCYLIYLTRGYLNIVFHSVFGLGWLSLIVISLLGGRFSRSGLRLNILAVVSTIGVIFLLIEVFPSSRVKDSDYQVRLEELQDLPPTRNSLNSPLEVVSPSIEALNIFSAPSLGSDTWRPHWSCAPYWTSTPWLPKFLDERFYSVSQIRRGYLYTKANTNFDQMVSFCRAMDVVAYFPRAVVLGFFGPLPSFWKEAGNESKGGTSFLRKIVSLELWTLYLFFPFFLIFLNRNKRNLELLFFIFSLVLLVGIFTVAIPSYGTLHRFRYVGQTVLVGLGFSEVFFQAERLVQWLLKLKRSLKFSTGIGEN